jgi:hypothetical protein
MSERVKARGMWRHVPPTAAQGGETGGPDRRSHFLCGFRQCFAERLLASVSPLNVIPVPVIDP